MAGSIHAGQRLRENLSGSAPDDASSRPVERTGATRMLRLSQVVERVGLGRTTIYALQKAGQFPHSVALTVNSVRWIEAEVEGWLAKRGAARAPGPTP
jgi:prophage regulatory protein